MFLLVVVAVICGCLVGLSVLLTATMSLHAALINRRIASEGLKSMEAFLRATTRGA